MIKKVFFMVVIITFTIGCDSKQKEITRDEAKDLIIADIGYPVIEFGNCELGNGFFKKYGNYNVLTNRTISSSGWINIKDMVDLGLIRMSDNGKKYNYRFTNLSKKLAKPGTNISTVFGSERGQLPIFVYDIGEITGIKYDNESKTEATIEFAQNLVLKTKFHKLLQQNMTSKDSSNWTVKISYYDDGWRVKNTSKNNYFVNSKDYQNWKLYPNK